MTAADFIFIALFVGVLSLLLHMAYDFGYDRGWDAHTPPQHDEKSP